VRSPSRGCVSHSLSGNFHPRPAPRFPPSVTMSATNQAAGPSRASRSTDNFTVIFQAASTEYERVTGKRLDSHPFATQLDSCDSPEAVLNALRTQVQAFDKSCKVDEKLMAWLDPMVHILFTFSATLGEGIGLVSHPICSVEPFFDTRSSAILARQNYLYRNRCSPRGELPAELSRRA
jgi:hypothetical protein